MPANLESGAVRGTDAPWSMTSETYISRYWEDAGQLAPSSAGWKMVRPERIELPTSWFVAMRSIQLSYGRNFRFAFTHYIGKKFFSVTMGKKYLALRTNAVKPRPFGTASRRSMIPKESVRRSEFRAAETDFQVNTEDYYVSNCANSRQGSHCRAPVSN